MKSAYFYDDKQMVLQTEGGELTQRYLWSDQIDQLIAVETVVAPTVYWALTDHLGTVRDLVTYNDTTETTELVKHRVFDSFGNVISDDAPSIILAFGYTGRWYDITTGLQWNLNRWYDPKLGQWVSEDPIEFDGDPTNMRRYVLNRASLSIDPDGLDIYLAKGRATQFDFVLGFVHQDIIVDTWTCRDGHYRKTGNKAYSFGLNGKEATFLPQHSWLGFRIDAWDPGNFRLTLKQVEKVGSVYSKDNIVPRVIIRTLSTEPEGDIKWMKYMDDQRFGQEDRYTLYWNCIAYTNLEFAAAPRGVLRVPWAVE